MGMRTVEGGAAASIIERSENTILYALAVVVPSMMALMMFSYVLFPPLFTALFIAIVAVAVLVMIPARRAHEMHFRAWVKNTMPTKLMTSAIGMIYITVTSVFSVAMLSLYKGLNPEQPATFAIMAGLLVALLGVMTYQSGNKQRFLSTEKRFFHLTPRAVEESLVAALTSEGHEHWRFKNAKGARVELPRCGLKVHIHALGGSTTEVMVENISESNREVACKVKEILEGVAQAGPRDSPRTIALAMR
jgi:hypothetical protein